ncbi:pirin family protein [Klugiella xanthotipulae]|uniref:Pirin n=1 Tax=Klugiella xanthotipulae TaxID=244735 RepID=A0A543I5J0_9MICO|nr:pirin family protein [Klugiella xanthotipulae]TQM65865.1 hypothetical protein FB466_0682 [Klugiella xanthotipulae]
MGNTEAKPQEVADRVGQRSSTIRASGAVTIIEARNVPLGGVRAMTVRRTLPHRERSTIGAWCFADHYGPDDLTAGPGMVVPPHPHTGLQTVSWLFSGEIEHRDSTGSHEMVRPGELNLMTAGRGISHSEVSTDAERYLHGVQLWTVLPDASRRVAAHFEHHTIPAVHYGQATLLVFMGQLAGFSSPATTYSPLVGAEIRLPANADVVIPVQAGFEHGVLVDEGEVRLNATEIPRRALGIVAPGFRTLQLRSGDAPARIILLGGEPLNESIVMWWNFIARSHEEIVEMRAQWQVEVVGSNGRPDPRGRYGVVAGYPGKPLPAPATPMSRLKPRRQ